MYNAQLNIETNQAKFLAEMIERFFFISKIEFIKSKWGEKPLEAWWKNPSLNYAKVPKTEKQRELKQEPI